MSPDSARIVTTGGVNTGKSTVPSRTPIRRRRGSSDFSPVDSQARLEVRFSRLLYTDNFLWALSAAVLALRAGLVKRRKLKWYGHVTRSSGLAKSILQGTVQGGRRRGRQKNMWRQHQRVDWPWMEYTTTESRDPRGVVEAGCKTYSGAPTVSQTTG